MKKNRNQLMKIDNHILALSMEFEKNNIIINEYEGEKVKSRSRKRSEASKRRRRRRAKAENSGSTDADNEESGFEEDDNEDNGDAKESSGMFFQMATQPLSRSLHLSPCFFSSLEEKANRVQYNVLASLALSAEKSL